MDTGYPVPVEENNDERGDAQQAVVEDNHEQDDAPQSVRRSSTRHRHTRRPEASAVLGKVRVSKPKKQNTQAQKPKAPELEPVIQDSDVIPLTSIPQAPKRRETKPRRTKNGTPLGPPRPQRVSKAKRFADTRGKSLPGHSAADAGQSRSPDRARSKRKRRNILCPCVIMANEIVTT
jgi:hypothetical protein